MDKITKREMYTAIAEGVKSGSFAYDVDEIVAFCNKEIDALDRKAAKAKEPIDERLLVAYNRIRNNFHNGLAVVTVTRDACGGCFNRIPPQRQADIRQGKKLIVCEYCGRILVSE